VAKPAKSAENKKVQPRLSALTHDYLQDLAETGLYGNNPTEVAKRLIETGVMEAIGKRHINVRHKTKSKRR
jgi:hypothetical protein